MYNNSYGMASSMTNNPFLDDPNDSKNRFPDISATLPLQASATTQYTSSWVSAQPTGPVNQQPYPQYQQFNYPVQPQPTGFGQQQTAVPISGSSYGYLTGQTTQQVPSYNPAQQQLLANPGYVAQFDPYGPLSQGTVVQTTTTSNAPQLLSPAVSVSSVGSFIVPSTGTPTTSRSSSGIPHPREFVKTHKMEVESWDGYAWKQLLNTFESLKGAWETRKQELATKVMQLQQQMQYADYFQAQQIQQEGGRLQSLLKEAEFNFDSVAASSFQMKEVYGGYRQSGDQSSKHRVREATNAALKTIPDWPPQVI